MLRYFATPLRPCLLVCAVALAVLSGATSQAAEQLNVDARVTDAGVAVSASARLRAPLSVIWQTLTDYDHLADFIPGMKRSRVIGRFGSSTIVEQAGSSSGLLSYPINVVVESNEQPPTTISVRILSGNLRVLQGAYHLQKVDDRDDEFILSWSGLVRPDIDLPAFIEEPALRKNVRDQFQAMVDEIERRQKGHMS